MRELNGHYPYLIAVHAFIYNPQGEVLLLQRANTGYMDGWWSVPAGHVEANESVVEAMNRELQEEIGLLLPEGIQPAHVMHRLKPADERVDFFFAIPEWEGTPTNCEPEKCSALQWQTQQTFPQNTIPYILAAHAQVQQKNPFSVYYDEV